MTPFTIEKSPARRASPGIDVRSEDVTGSEDPAKVSSVWSPTALAYSAEVASATKAGRPWHLSTRVVGRNPPTFVGRSRLRTAKAEAHPPCLLRRSSRFGCEGRAPRLRRVPTSHSSTGLHPWPSAQEGKIGRTEDGRQGTKIVAP